MAAFLKSELADIPVKRGKVRDIYEFDDRLLFVATDRISAFDWVLPSGIPDKGRVLTQLSEMWFRRLDVPNHFLSMDPEHVPLPDGAPLDDLKGRSMVVKRGDVIPVECVVRGYLSGSGWKEYKQSQTVCGIPLPAGLQESAKLDEPIFTPATKAETGHDENISFEVMCEKVGTELSEKLRDMSLAIYNKGADYAKTRDIIIADTKFEFGMLDGEIMLIDEVLTPDSSRFWPIDQYEPGRGQASFDKQFVRDWLEQTDWDKNSEPPELPDEIIARTREKYIEAYEMLVDTGFEWKIA
jgi:phosphoribosylaminoimidazole-succinocarboxamide synthase